MVSEVAAICAMRDRVIRNLRITECYHRLSLAMAARTGACANWCTFATWASRQAGSTIRGEDLLARLSGHSRQGWALAHPVRSLWRMMLRQGMFNADTALGRLVRAVHTPFDAFERASEAVAEGNLKVFEEIGAEFARYLETCPPDAPVDSGAFAGFLSGFRPGDPPEGQEYLRRAFLCYQRQSLEGDPVRRAQLIVLANLEIGLHEQTRLQPQIQKALESGSETAEDLGARAWRALFHTEAAPGLLCRPLGFVLVRYRRFAAALTRQAVTECMMVLSLPGMALELGRNLDVPYPEPLREIGSEELRELCARFEPPGACVNCGADDWADLKQRMHYILHLFRAFHLHPELASAPFAAAQMEQIRAGLIPGGDL
jgi:hypothetical protein